MVEYWQLRIIDTSGTAIALVGTEEVMRFALDEWVAMVDASCLSGKLVSVKGTTDSVDRAPSETVILADDIRAMILVRLY